MASKNHPQLDVNSRSSIEPCCFRQRNILIRLHSRHLYAMGTPPGSSLRYLAYRRHKCSNTLRAHGRPSTQPPTDSRSRGRRNRHEPGYPGYRPGPFPPALVPALDNHAGLPIKYRRSQQCVRHGALTGARAALHRGESPRRPGVSVVV